MKAVMTTNYGDIDIELDVKSAPISVQNFVEYVNAGFYDGTIFHRVIDDFMIQGGGFDKDMQEKQTRKGIQNESKNGLRNDKYSIAMARTMEPHSASSQFFINVKDNDFLNFTAEDMYGWGYAVFGKVVAGFDVVDKIKAVKTSRHGIHRDVPLEAVIINSVTIVEEA